MADFKRMDTRDVALYANVPYPYQSLDGDGVMRVVNPAWLDLFGYPETEVLGTPWVDFVAEDCRQAVCDTFQGFKSTGRLSGLFTTVHRKDGTAVPVRIDGRVERGPGGVFVRTHCFLLDMRPELEARRALEESEVKYRRLVERALGGLWQIDAEGRTTFVNKAMAEMLEYTPEEFQGKHLFDFMDERGIELAKRLLAKRKQGVAEQHDFEFITRSGRRVIAFMNTRPIRKKDGTYDGAIAEAVDVTLARQREKEAFHAQKLESLGVMAGGIAHDFNNLLQAVMGNLDLVDQEVGPGSTIGPFLDDIRVSALRARDLCRQMLAYSGRTDFTIEDIDLGSLVRQMQGLMAVSMDKNTELRIEVRGKTPPVYGDPSQLRQVVMNLVTNGSEALGGNPGRVAVRISARDFTQEEIAGMFPASNVSEGPFVVLEVEDTGCGMDETTRQRLFDPFFSTKFTGRGMGMAAVKGIVDAHFGAIRVESKPWEGTRVVVILPRSASRQVEKQVPGRKGGTAGDGGGRTVLVADDEEMVRRMLDQMLSRLGFRVEAVENGRQAIEAVERNPMGYDHVLLDMTMPEVDGTQAFRRIREINPQVPVLIFSGFPSDDVSVRFPDPKPDGFLQKPFNMEELKLALGVATGPV